MRKTPNLLIVTMLFFCLSCEEETTQVAQTDIFASYSGTFTVKYKNGESYSNDVQVHLLEDNSYSSSGNGNQDDFYPAGGSGSFRLENGEIQFSDSNAWLAHFDWNLILAGDYEFTAEGEKLTLLKEHSELGTYTYELLKVDQ